MLICINGDRIQVLSSRVNPKNQKNRPSLGNGFSGPGGIGIGHKDKRL